MADPLLAIITSANREGFILVRLSQEATNRWYACFQHEIRMRQINHAEAKTAHEALMSAWTNVRNTKLSADDVKLVRNAKQVDTLTAVQQNRLSAAIDRMLNVL